MAWNEPGGGKDKDPWSGGKGNGNQGPPDLDEVVKKMQEKFGALFGGGSGSRGQGGSSGPKLGSFGIGLILLVAVAAWALYGFYTVDEGKRAVVLEFGKYQKTTMPGLQWRAPGIQTYDIVDVESLMLTQDENIVDIHLAVQYKIKSASDYVFRVVDPDETLRQATESALRETVGKKDLEDILTKDRAVLTSTVREQTQEILDHYQTGLLITSVNMQDAQPPEQVQAAFDDAVKAREDLERLKNEANAYKNDVVPRAEGKAQRMVEDAKAYKEQVIARAKGEVSRFLQILSEYKKAPEVTRKRLYVDAMQKVMSNSSKILVDIKGGNNLIYLPLDKMLTNGSHSSSSSSRTIEPIPPIRSGGQQPIRDDSRSEGRGTR